MAEYGIPVSEQRRLRQEATHEQWQAYADSYKGEPKKDVEWNLGELLREVQVVMTDRHRKYGPGNIAEFGELGILVRLADKFARVRNNQTKDFDDESVDDTLMDIIGYSLIWLLVRRGQWPGFENQANV